MKKKERSVIKVSKVIIVKQQVLEKKSQMLIFISPLQRILKKKCCVDKYINF
jgi:hypothetical protein